MKKSQANSLTQEILNYLLQHKVWAWRNSIGGIPVKGGGRRGSGMVGVSDILGVVPPAGRFLAIEAKIGQDRLRPEQEGFLSVVESLGGLVYVAKDFESFVNWFESIKKDP